MHIHFAERHFNIPTTRCARACICVILHILIVLAVISAQSERIYVHLLHVFNVIFLARFCFFCVCIIFFFLTKLMSSETEIIWQNNRQPNCADAYIEGLL